MFTFGLDIKYATAEIIVSLHITAYIFGILHIITLNCILLLFYFIIVFYYIITMGRYIQTNTSCKG